MDFKIVNLGKDYDGKIHDFGKIRNMFIEQLEENEWILWKSDDEEIPLGLIKIIETLNPTFPYYAIRRINLINGKYSSWGNPELYPGLVSNKVRYVGRLHEHINPRKPYGVIDYPIIHSVNGPRKYSSGWKETKLYRPVMAIKKSIEIMRGR